MCAIVSLNECNNQYRWYQIIKKKNPLTKVSYARPSSEQIKDTNLYVTNLPKTITEEQLDVIFGKYGTIVQKNILRDKVNGKPRGVAFVRWVSVFIGTRLRFCCPFFSYHKIIERTNVFFFFFLCLCEHFRFCKREEAQEAISALNNVIPEGGNQPLVVRLAEEHGKQKANLYYMNSMNVNMMNNQHPNYSNYNNYNAHNNAHSGNVMHRGRARVRFPNMCPY